MEKILSNIVDAFWNTTIGGVHIYVYLTITVLALIIIYKPLKICYKIQKELEPIDWDGCMDSEDEKKVLTAYFKDKTVTHSEVKRELEKLRG